MRGGGNATINGLYRIKNPRVNANRQRDRKVMETKMNDQRGDRDL